MVTQKVWCLSVRCLNEDILPDSLPLTFRPHHADDAEGRSSTQRAEEPVAATQTRGAQGVAGLPGSDKQVAATQTRGAHPLEQGRGKGAGHPIKAPQAGGALA